MNTSKRYSPEVRGRAVRLVREVQQENSSQWAAIQPISAKIGCTHETLRRWVRQAHEILRKASAFFAQAELDRGRK